MALLSSGSVLKIAAFLRNPCLLCSVQSASVIARRRAPGAVFKLGRGDASSRDEIALAGVEAL